MKVNFGHSIKPLEEGVARLYEDGPVLTLGKVCAPALNNPNGVQRGALALKLYSMEEEADISPEEAALVRGCLGGLMPVVAAQAHTLLG